MEHYPEHEGEIAECSLVEFSSWEVCAWAGHGGALDSVDVGDAISLVPYSFSSRVPITIL